MVGNNTNLLEITENQQFLSNPSAITHKKNQSTMQIQTQHMLFEFMEM